MLISIFENGLPGNFSKKERKEKKKATFFIDAYIVLKSLRVERKMFIIIQVYNMDLT